MGPETVRICCLGAGYVGGPTMAVIAEKCSHAIVTVVDINPAQVGLSSARTRGTSSALYRGGACLFGLVTGGKTRAPETGMSGFRAALWVCAVKHWRSFL